MTASVIMDNSTTKTLNHDLSDMSHLNVVGQTIEPEQNQSIQEIDVFNGPKSEEKQQQVGEKNKSENNQSLSSCCSDVTCIPCISQKAEQKLGNTPKQGHTPK